MTTTDFAPLVNRVVDDHAKELWELSRFLFENPELALTEVKAHDKLCEFLEGKGFVVQREYCLKTAFRAEFDAPAGSDGRCVALLCEFDALPDIGHGCGHNLIAEASVGAALAVQEAMKSSKDMRGKLVVLGTPAEEYACGKELLIRQGALDGIEVAIMSHPTPADVVAPLCSASQELVVRFKGKSAHAAAYPWEGVNALDAAIASFVNIGLLRQQCKPSSWIHGIIAEGGKYANVIPEETELRFCVRSDSNAELILLRDRVEACFKGAAEATGCEVSIRRAAAYMDVIQNAAIAASYRKHGHSLGLTFIDDYVKKLTVSGASTDCGNVSHRVPTLHAVYSVGSKEKVRGPANHTHQFATLAGSEEAQSPTLRTAKVLALTVLDLLTDAELMRKAQAEFAALQLQSDAELQAMTQ
ncbi:peptidase M20 domain-containing protein 2-like isoform X1 [Dermacentor silvarum]|uniref:peptidase M20 domain-containing protein 2-like isoform X1 n=1 Tax=Dermacentor silvarum TaxID=543639 RepID=UPI002101C52C|nr:peptidase M20 domain-containing protein 2-like isoform X1 [Dermacentor silvarum]